MRSLWVLLPVMLSSLTLAGCELVGDIFEAGVWVGVILVGIVAVLMAVVVAKLRG